MNKSGFLTFLFALLPGAGHMYLGMPKKGTMLMLSFFLLIGLSGFFGLNFLVFILPVIWFYSFFDTFNVKHFTIEEMQEMDDRFLKHFDGFFAGGWHKVIEKRHAVLGTVLILLGVYMFFHNVFGSYLYEISRFMPWLGELISQLPTVFVAVLVIIAGIFLVRGKKAAPEKDFVEYNGREDDE